MSTFDWVSIVDRLPDAIVPGAAGLGLLLFLMQLWQLRSGRKDNHNVRRHLDLVVDKLSTLEMDRAISETESRTLRRLAETSTVDDAVNALLEHCLPETNAGLAAYFDLSPDGDAHLRKARGHHPEYEAYLAVDPDWTLRLASEAFVELVGADARRTAFFSRLAVEDQERVSRIILFRVGTGVRPSGILVTTELPPAIAPLPVRIELVQRLLAALGSFLHRSEEIRRQQDELRLTRELLELRCLVDTHLGSPVELLEEFLERVTTATGFDRAVLYLASGMRLDSKPLVCVGAPLPRGIADLWRLDEASLARKGMQATGLTFLNAGDLHALRVRSTMCGACVVSLSHDDTLIGVVCMARQQDAPLGQGDRQLLQWATDYLRETMLRTVDRAMIEQQARRDALTQLANRHTFDREIRRQLEDAMASGGECGLIMLDVDRFKSLNDLHGHLAGDEVLRVVARTVESCVGRMRSTDRPLVARYGGEELAVLLPGVPIHGAKRIAEQIIEAIRAAEVPFDGKTIRMTISAGIAVCPKDGTAPTDLIAAADGALYRAKNNGRDRWEAAGEERPETLRIASFTG
jgi:diguanylate cyclase (GGDEF)-like protein